MNSVTYTAYVFLHFKLVRDSRRKGKKRPIFSYVHIYSGRNLTQKFDGKECIAELCHATGESFDEATQNVIDLCKRIPNYSWIIPWLDSAREEALTAFAIDRDRLSRKGRR